MNRSHSRALSLLLCAMLLTGLFAGCGNSTPPAETAAPSETAAVNSAAPKNTLPPRESAAPADGPEPTDEPEPTDAPADGRSLSEKAVGVWKLHATEVDGDYNEYDAWDDSTYLRFRENGSVDFYRFSPWFATVSELGAWTKETEDGLEFRFYPYDSPVDYTITGIDGDEMTVHAVFSYEDGQMVGSLQVYRRSSEDGMNAAPRHLSDWELSELANELTHRSFLYSTYSRPEEIDWREVLYDGAGIGAEVTDELRAAYEKATGWPIELDVEMIPGDALRDFCWTMTGTDYGSARRPVNDWTYLADYDLWCWEHGDTNYQSIEFDDGWKEGGDYYLSFLRSDWETYRGERRFTAHLRRVGDGWQYVSVTPASAEAPRELLTIEYFDARPNADHSLPVEALDSDQPDAWRWALLTAQTDGVRVSIDRCRPGTYAEEAFATGMGAPVLNDNLGEFELDAGERVAVQVCLAWNPTMRVSAACAGLWGCYWFGEDNALHLDDDGFYRPRWVMGHDLDGEGRGTWTWSEEDLSNFLSSGGGTYDAWFWYDAGGHVGAVLEFYNYRGLTIHTAEESWPLLLDFDYLYNESWDAPDLLRLEKYDSYDACWSGFAGGAFASDALGDYRIEVEQREGEQIMTLTQVNNGDGVLAYLLGVDTHSYRFTFRRAVGTVSETYAG
ncbi:MAG: hypothetical protein IJR65_08270 [Oscillospiraceae bacterium]|nr:hypothetical protein [Oscillospiraceae bacterium]